MENKRRPFYRAQVLYSSLNAIVVEPPLSDGQLTALKNTGVITQEMLDRAYQVGGEGASTCIPMPRHILGVAAMDQASQTLAPQIQSTLNSADFARFEPAR